MSGTIAGSAADRIDAAIPRPLGAPARDILEDGRGLMFPPVMAILPGDADLEPVP
jgi:hypothetical protein